MSTSRQRKVAREKAKALWPLCDKWNLTDILMENNIHTNPSGFEIYIKALEHRVLVTAAFVLRRLLR